MHPLIAFLMACDENTLTRVLHRPLAACTIFGAVLGNAPAGLAAGAVLEIEAVAFDAVMPSNYILPSLAAAVAAVNGGGVSGAMAGAGFWLVGLLLKEVSSLICTALLPAARKAAETRKEGGLTMAVILSLVINGLVFGLAAMFLASKGAELTDFFRVLRDEGFFRAEAPYIMSIEIKPQEDEDADVVLANTKRVIRRAWAMLED